MHRPPPILIDVLNDLDDHLAAEILTFLRTLTTALEHHYAGVLARQQQHDWESRQPTLWSDDEPPF